jgi:hypothetical protein
MLREKARPVTKPKTIKAKCGQRKEADLRKSSWEMTIITPMIVRHGGTHVYSQFGRPR